MIERNLTLSLNASSTVSALWMEPQAPSACLVLSHGAGAGMGHKSMTAIADGLCVRGIATLRYQFPYMERGGGRVDSPKVAHATVRAAVSEARRQARGLPLFAGGKSFGGRMTSQAQAIEPLEDVRALVFFAFPLHPVGVPSEERATHLIDVTIPMLFLSGTRDALADTPLLRDVVKRLGARATLLLTEGADHSFHVPAKSGRRDTEVLAELLDATAGWMAAQSTA